MLFEVPKEGNSNDDTTENANGTSQTSNNDNNAVDDTTENANGTKQPSNNDNDAVDGTTENVNGSSRPLDVNNNHNNSAAENADGANRSHETLAVNNPSIKDANSASDSPNANLSNKKKVNFQGVPRCSTVNTDTIGSQRSPRIAALKKKQLDPILNHVGFIQTNKAPEEDYVEPMKETCAFKEAMASPYKKHFVEAMEKEMHDHVKQ